MNMQSTYVLVYLKSTCKVTCKVLLTYVLEINMQSTYVLEINMQSTYLEINMQSTCVLNTHNASLTL